jgi:hypothetical protein
MSFERVLEWLANTKGSIALHESFYVWPAIESVHVLTLSVFVGFAAMLDLRLLGVAMGHMPASKVARRLLPWTAAGFVTMVVSGVLIFYANPVHFYHNVFFRAKVLLLILAGLNAWVFHARVWHRVAMWDLDQVTPAAARLAGASSLLLWACIIMAGRLIAYDWFDCDKPQQAIVYWVSGCNPGK